MRLIQSCFVGSNLASLVKANIVQLSRADSYPEAEMSLSVGWNRLLMRLFLPKLCSMAPEETESDIDL